MERLNIYFSDISAFILVMLLTTYCISTYGQGNCLIYAEESGERIACELSYRAIEYRQGSKASQLIFDAAIEAGSNYAYAYYQKSVPYFKRGLIHEGVQLLNEAIALEPINYLCYRAYWYYSHRSYSACISDLERYYSTLNGPIKFTPGGDMEMRMLLGLTYAQTNKLKKGIESVLMGLDSYGKENYLIGSYDYHILGVLYYKDNQLDKAAEAFEKQIIINDNFADSYYYFGLVRKNQSNRIESRKLFKESLNRFEGKNNGYSFNGFLDFNVSKALVKREINKVPLSLPMD
jgi:tetratricopeptide (TPR) repeat protein